MTRIQPSTAVDRLKQQTGKLTFPSELERAAEQVTLDHFLLDVSLQHHVKLNIGEAVQSGYVERTMDGASNVQVTIHDPYKDMINSNIFGTNTNTSVPVIDVFLDGLWFRLVQFQKQGTQITLTFEDRIVAFLRLHKRPKKASRNNSTRAQFIRSMVLEVKAANINFFCPELNKKQPITAPISPHQRASTRGPGLLTTTDLTAKGAALKQEQLTIAEKVLDTGVSMGASRKLLIASMMCIIQESNISILNSPNGYGPFSQLKNGAWPATGDPVKDAAGFFTAAIAADKANPNISTGGLVQTVQHSAYPTAYDKWKDEAGKIVDEYGKAPGQLPSRTSYIKMYEYHRGQPDGPLNENSWDCSLRLANEVNWRRFVVGNTFYYVQDSDLINQKPRMELDEDTRGVDTIDFDIDANKPVAEAVVHCRADRWIAPPGCVVKLVNIGPANGRWLVWTIHRDLFSNDCTITLRQPQSQKPEPAPQVVTTSGSADGSIVSGGLIFGGDTRARIVAAAQWGLAHASQFHYAQVRPMASSLFSPKALNTTDCSAFVTLCYKAAGAGDPNNLGYNGSGYTGTLWAHGGATNTPQPGDLAFYHPDASGTPGHVAIFIGNGMVISQGRPGLGPNTYAVQADSGFMGYRTYDTTNYNTNPSRPTPAQGGGPAGPGALTPGATPPSQQPGNRPHRVVDPSIPQAPRGPAGIGPHGTPGPQGPSGL